MPDADAAAAAVTHDSALSRADGIFGSHNGNMLRYRIVRIEQLTGRNLSRFEDRVDFFLALRLPSDGDLPFGR
ncbi:MAG: helix-turn-helix domain-containing protein [Micromonospora sp.]